MNQNKACVSQNVDFYRNAMQYHLLLSLSKENLELCEHTKRISRKWLMWIRYCANSALDCAILLIFVVKIAAFISTCPRAGSPAMPLFLRWFSACQSILSWPLFLWQAATSSSSSWLRGNFLDKVLDKPVVVQRQVPELVRTVVLPWRCAVANILVVARRLLPLVQLFMLTGAALGQDWWCTRCGSTTGAVIQTAQHIVLKCRCYS